jgi:hypothetical protein
MLDQHHQNNRFYPDSLPHFKHEPNKQQFEIVTIGDSVGEGVKTKVTFDQGELVFQFTGFLSSDITLFSLQIEEGVHLHDPFFMGKVLHSCDPNTIVDMKKRTFTAARPIAAGEFITMDYASTETQLYRNFNCCCGAKHCRGKVKGSNE